MSSILTRLNQRMGDDILARSHEIRKIALDQTSKSELEGSDFEGNMVYSLSLSTSIVLRYKLAIEIIGDVHGYHARRKSDQLRKKN